MMRELQFRAWDKEESKMYKVEALMDYGVQVNEMVDDDGNNVLFDCEHIMQYTGLKDWNGTEIYEGDIVEKKLWNGVKHFNVLSFKPFVVEWRKCGFNLGFMNPHSCEILGNIYENKELLEDK